MKVPSTIIVHTHKCGGTALREGLTKALGPEVVHADYTSGMQDPELLFHIDREAYWRRALPPPISGIVIGHFHIGLFRHNSDAIKVALLRHPVDRLISHYFFWRHAPINSKNWLLHSVKRGDYDLVGFSQIPLIKGLYRNVYFIGVDMSSFDLLIVYERFQLGVATLSRLLGIHFQLPQANSTDDLFPEYAAVKRKIVLNRALMVTLVDSLRQEIDFYERCISLSNAA